MLRKSYKIYVIQQVYRFCWMFLEEQQKKVMEIYFFLGIIPTAFCKSVMCLKRKMTRSASVFSLKDVQSGHIVGTPGGIRTHGLPLRSFCLACALALVWDRLSLVVQGWRAIYCSSEFAFSHLKSPERGVSCLQDVCKSNKGGRTLRPIYRFLFANGPESTMNHRLHPFVRIAIISVD